MIFRDVVGYSGYYEVSTCGTVRSVDRIVTRGDGQKERRKGGVLKQVNVNGYCAITLSKNGVRRQHKVHRLVMEAHCPNPNNLPQINHKDGNKLNNKLNNLEWCTAKSNVKHAWDKGLNKKRFGEDNPMFGKKGAWRGVPKEKHPCYGRVGDKHPLYGKKGKDCAASKPVRNVETGEIFETVYEAAASLGMNKNTLYYQLREAKTNKTPIRYIV